MKTRIKIATIFAVLLMSNFVFAGTDKPVFKIKNTGEKTFYFETSEMSSTFVEVTFQDKNGKTIFSEYAIHTTDFERKYNLSELANGSYFLVVKSDTTSQILPISITKKGLDMEWGELETM